MTRTQFFTPQSIGTLKPGTLKPKRLSLPLTVSLGAHAVALIWISGTSAAPVNHSSIEVDLQKLTAVEIVAGDGAPAPSPLPPGPSVHAPAPAAAPRPLAEPAATSEASAAPGPTDEGGEGIALPAGGNGTDLNGQANQAGVAGLPGPGTGAGGGGGGEVGTDMSAYLRLLQERVGKYRRYPEIALRMGFEGVAKVTLVLNPDGSLADLPTVSESSGHDILDDEARHIIERAAPFPPLHGFQGPIKLKVPVHFQLES